MWIFFFFADLFSSKYLSLWRGFIWLNDMEKEEHEDDDDVIKSRFDKLWDLLFPWLEGRCRKWQVIWRQREGKAFLPHSSHPAPPVLVTKLVMLHTVSTFILNQCPCVNCHIWWPFMWWLFFHTLFIFHTCNFEGLGEPAKAEVLSV